jgi:hypothetical protein
MHPKAMMRADAMNPNPARHATRQAMFAEFARTEAHIRFREISQPNAGL